MRHTLELQTGIEGSVTNCLGGPERDRELLSQKAKHRLLNVDAAPIF